MNLLGTPFLVLVLLGTVVVVGGVAVTWERWPRHAAWPLRLVGLVAVATTGALLAGTLVNRSFGFYGSLAELLGPARATDAVLGPETTTGSATASSEAEVLDPGWQAEGAAAARHGRGTVLQVRLGGGRSGISRVGVVYLPAAWFLDRGRGLPVVELLHGYPGVPQNLQDQLRIGPVLDREIAADRVPPVVAVAPKTYDGRASECVDAGARHLDETYLVHDVPAALHQAFGTLQGRALGLLGYSEGGFCAVDMALHHPDRVVAAVSLSGYFTAGTDPHTLDLYRGHPGLRDHDSPLWWVAHRPVTAPPLLVVSSGDDADAVRQDEALRRAAAEHAPRLRLLVAELPHGGHNFGTFARALPAGLDFLGARLPAPLAPPLLLPPAPGPRPGAASSGRRAAPTAGR